MPSLPGLAWEVWRIHLGIAGAWSLPGYHECYKGAIAASQARTDCSKSQLAPTLSPDEGGGGSQWGNHSAPSKVKWVAILSIPSHGLLLHT